MNYQYQHTILVSIDPAGQVYINAFKSRTESAVYQKELYGYHWRN